MKAVEESRAGIERGGLFKRHLESSSSVGFTELVDVRQKKREELSVTSRLLAWRQEAVALTHEYSKYRMGCRCMGRLSERLRVEDRCMWIPKFFHLVFFKQLRQFSL